MDASVAESRGAIVDELQQRIVDLKTAGAPVPDQWIEILKEVADTGDAAVVKQAQDFVATLPPIELKTTEVSWGTFEAFSKPTLDDLTLQYVRGQIMGNKVQPIADKIKAITAIRDNSGTPTEALAKLADVQKSAEITEAQIAGVQDVTR